MKQLVFFLCLTFFFPFILVSQKLPGEYIHKTSNGEIQLMFESPFQNSLKGKMIDENGATYDLTGTTADQVTVSGTLSSSQGGSMFFQAQGKKVPGMLIYNRIYEPTPFRP